MIDASLVVPPSQGEHERTDISVPGLVLIAIGLVVVAALLQVTLWGLHRAILPKTNDGTVSFPVRMPGEPPVNARIEAIPQPRLDSLTRLQAEPPSYRSSRPISELDSPQLHPEDLRANRQPILRSYGWVDREKGIARIPIDQAMKAILGSARLTSSPNKRGQP